MWSGGDREASMFGSDRGRILEQGRAGGSSSRIPELLESLQKDFEQVCEIISLWGLGKEW